MICLDSDKKSCGCRFLGNGEILPKCDCVVLPFPVTRKELRSMSKYTLFKLYTRTLSDEMSPIMWRGYAKAEILEMFLQGKNSVELMPFI